MNRFVFSALCGLALVACGGDKDGSDSAAGSGSGTGTATGGPGGTGTATGSTTTPDVVGDMALIGPEEALPAAGLLSIWGSSSSDVWIVGSDDGAGPVVLHWDGAAWSRVETGTTGDLWWVWGDGAGTVFFAGAGGRVVVHDVAGGTFEEMAVADPAVTLFGLWGTSSDDVWTVGGDITGNVDGTIQHWDGATWTEVATAPSVDDTQKRMAFKVWGRSADEVYVVGTNALVMEGNVSGFTTVDPSPLYISTPITTVAGDADNVYAVGGYGNAAVARKIGSGAWEDDSPPPTAIAPFFNGVSVRDGVVVACGGQGSIWSREDTEWLGGGEPLTTRDFHGCWIDPDGAVWAVGGDLSGLTAGVVVTNNASVGDISL